MCGLLSQGSQLSSLYFICQSEDSHNSLFLHSLILGRHAHIKNYLIGYLPISRPSKKVSILVGREEERSSQAGKEGKHEVEVMLAAAVRAGVPPPLIRPAPPPLVTQPGQPQNSPPPCFNYEYPHPYS
jgi:hypothetical protein